jgi:hypothetical protein
MVSLNQQRFRLGGIPAHLARSICHGNQNRGFGIILLLEFEKRFLDCIQLALGIETNPTLQGFKRVVHSESFWSTYIPIRRFEGET